MTLDSAFAPAGNSSAKLRQIFYTLAIALTANGHIVGQVPAWRLLPTTQPKSFAFDSDHPGSVIAVSISRPPRILQALTFYGEEFRSTDQGTTWSRVSDLSQTLETAFYTKRGAIAFSGDLIFRRGSSAEWYGTRLRIVNPHQSAEDADVICGVGSNGSGVLFSSNGGVSFEQITPATTIGNSVQEVGCEGDIVWVRAKEAVVISQDKGSTWRALKTPPPPLKAVRFSRDGIHGWAATPKGVFRTVDFGDTWSTTSTPYALTQFAMRRAAGVAWDSQNRIAVTRDAGITWRQLRTKPTGDIRIITVSQDDPEGFLLLSSSGRVWTVSVSGENLSLIGTENLRPMFVDWTRGRVWATDTTGLVWRHAGGSKWFRPAVPTTERVHSLFFQENPGGRGWALAGNNGKLLTTRDGGDTWAVVPNTPKGAASFVYSAPSSNALWLGGPDLLCSAQDPGGQWRCLEEKGLGQIRATAISFGDSGQNGLLLGDGALSWTNDGGGTWHRANTPKTLSIRQMTLGSDGNTGFAVAKNMDPEIRGSAILRTTNGGRFWAPVYESSDVSYVTVATDHSCQAVWVAGYRLLMRAPGVPVEPAMLHSIDAGAHWFALSVPRWPDSTGPLLMNREGSTGLTLGSMLTLRMTTGNLAPKISTFEITRDLLPVLQVDRSTTPHNECVVAIDLDSREVRRVKLEDLDIMEPLSALTLAPDTSHLFRVWVSNGIGISSKEYRLEPEAKPGSLDSSTGETISDLGGVDLNTAVIQIGGKYFPASSLLLRGQDGQVRLRGDPPSFLNGVQGFVPAVVKGTQARVTFIVEHGKLRLFRPYQKSYALIIAIAAYPATSGYPKLPQAVTQARELERVLKAQGFLMLPPLYDHLATAENIRSALRRAPATEEDRLFVYFGGHGDQQKGFDGNPYGYIIPYDASREHLDERGIPLDELRGRFAKTMPAKQVLFALDSCQSGLAIARAPNRTPIELLRALRDIDTMSRHPGRMFLTAGRRDQAAIDVNGGIFTRALIEAIQGKADGSSNGVTTFYELYEYIRKRVDNEARDHGRQQNVDEDVVLGERGWVFVHDRTILP